MALAGQVSLGRCCLTKKGVLKSSDFSLGDAVSLRGKKNPVWLQDIVKCDPGVLKMSPVYLVLDKLLFRCPDERQIAYRARQTPHFLGRAIHYGPRKEELPHISMVLLVSCESDKGRLLWQRFLQLVCK